MPITHNKVSLVVDGTDTNLVRPSDWNENHVVADYDDLPPSPIIGARLGSTAPTLATFIDNIEQYTFDATNDYVIGATEIMHGYDEGTTIYPHIHWATNGSDVGETGVKWQLEYTIANGITAFGSSATLTVDVTIPGGTTDRTHYVSEFTPTITGTSVTIGAYILWKLSRIASAKSAPAANPFGLAIGFHVLMDSIGSANRLSK